MARLDKGYPTGHINHFTIPSGELASTLVLEVLKVPPSKAPNRKREAKVAQRKSGTRCRDVLKDVIEVNISTPNRGNGALLEIGAKAGHLPKTLENTREILDVALDGSHKHGRIVRMWYHRPISYYDTPTMRWGLYEFLSAYFVSKDENKRVK
jgi:hypothetical protein